MPETRRWRFIGQGLVPAGSSCGCATANTEGHLGVLARQIALRARAPHVRRAANYPLNFNE